MQLLEDRLTQFKTQGLTRSLQQPLAAIDLCSNDYLGFATDPVLQKNFHRRLQTLACGATGSRLLRGHSALFTNTEDLLAAFVYRQSALLFSSGYAANVGLLSAVLSAEDWVFSDEYNHASIIDGIQLSKAQKIIFPHCDYAHLEQQLSNHQAHPGLKVIVTESIFSMSGVQSDLRKLADLAQRYQALLIIDEAHSTGIWGHSLVHTLGLTDHVFATVHAAGKALGAAGAWVAGDAFLKEYLIHFARSFIFSTAPLPALAALLQEAVKLYAEIGEERATIVRQRARWLRSVLNDKTADETADSPILFIPVGDNQRSLTLSHSLQQQGFDVRAIRPPTVKPGAAGLRVTVKWCNTDAVLAKFVDCLQKM